MSDDVRELATKLRRQAERLEGYCRVILGRSEVPEAGVMRSIADLIERLHNENEGYHKANDLLNRGLESQCELMDGLKQDKRRLEAENDRLRAALRPFADYAAAVKGDWDDDTGTCLTFLNADGTPRQDAPRVTLGHCRAAAKALGEGGHE